jgi:hypothetical protein
MASAIPQDALGNLGVNINGGTGTKSLPIMGAQGAAAAVVGNPVVFGVNADAANGGAAVAQFAAGDSKLAQSVNVEGRKATFYIAFSVTPAASATDIAMIQGSATAVVKLTRLSISGVATAAALIDVLGVKRSAADTGGTSTNPVPVAADLNDLSGVWVSGATAIINVYTANPTLGASSATGYGVPRRSKMLLGVPAGTGSPFVLNWTFGERSEKAMTLRGVADSFCVNLNGVQSTGQIMNVEMAWTEE